MHMLQLQLIVAIAERARHVTAWKQLNSSIPAQKRSDWQAHVDAFHADATKPNPYMLDEMHDLLCLEWARAMARKMRWDEEVHLLMEEMRRATGMA
ncbi:hypothetical protein DFH06DRAFT_1344793 [Mycena polygramma]|nr:hypothetical protein DFH06DRAFT_1344793 [Mycena polygramma]